jgi:radical SAM superfamily enzyme YgiQ (UPF0313 family)
MKFLGLNPKDFYAGWPVQSDFGRELYRTPALTFPVLARLMPPGNEIRFLEGFFEPITMREYRDWIRWPDVVGMNIASSYGAISYAVAVRQIKRLNPRAFIMAGGHHANMFPERWLDLGVDLVVQGEAELSFTRIIEETAGARQFDRVPGVIFKRDGQVVRTATLPQIETLDESPLPDLDLINFKIYPALADARPGGATGSLECSRGCMFRCSFCAVPGYWKGTQRFKSVGRVMEEVKELARRKVTQINIVDDGFGNDPDYTAELAEAFARLPDKFSLNAFLRVDTALKRPDLVEKLARAGMKATLLGFESINEDVLKDCMTKGMRVKPLLAEYQEMYRNFHRHGILVIGVFISGHPDIPADKETSYGDARTVCDDPRLADYMPFPGAAGWDELAARYPIKDMFFHDVKLPVFPGQGINAMRFNLLNMVDLPRSLRMLAGPHQHRVHLLWSHYMLWSKFLRLTRLKLRDWRLLRRKDIDSAAKQERLMRLYLDNPGYEQWLDGLEDRVWF